MECDCYCKRSTSEDRLGVSCFNCGMIVHKECYKLDPEDNTFFYCEVCRLVLVEPLVANSTPALLEKLLTYNKVGICTFTLNLTRSQVNQLSEKSSFLNFYITEPGNLDLEAEKTVIFVNGDSHTIETNRYNLIAGKNLNTQSSRYNNRGSQSATSVKCSLTLNYFDKSRYLYVSIATILQPSVIYGNVMERRTSKLYDTKEVACLKTILEQSKGRSPFSLSLICPITIQLMIYPAKGMLCKHTAFFCAKHYIDLNLKLDHSPLKWKCPLCHRRVYYTEIFIDEDFCDVIQKYGERFRQHELEEISEKDMDELEDQEVDFKRLDRIYIYNENIYSLEDLEKTLPGIAKSKYHSTKTTLMRPSSAHRSPERLPSIKKVLPPHNINFDPTAVTAIEISYSMIAESNVLLVNKSPIRAIQEEVDPPRRSPRTRSHTRSITKTPTTKKTPSTPIIDEMINLKKEATPQTYFLNKYKNHSTFKENLKSNLARTVEFMPDIMERPSSTSWIADQIYMVATDVLSASPELDTLFLLLWAAADKLGDQARSFGELLGVVCQYAEDKFASAVWVMEIVKENCMIVGKELKDLVQEDIGDVVDGLAKFILGMARGLLLDKKGQGGEEVTAEEINLRDLIGIIIFLLNAFFDMELPNAQNNDGQEVHGSLVIAHVELAVIRLLASYLSEIVEKPEVELMIHNILLNRLKTLQPSNLEHYKDKYYITF